MKKLNKSAFITVMALFSYSGCASAQAVSFDSAGNNSGGLAAMVSDAKADRFNIGHIAGDILHNFPVPQAPVNHGGQMHGGPGGPNVSGHQNIPQQPQQDHNNQAPHDQHGNNNGPYVPEQHGYPGPHNDPGGPGHHDYPVDHNGPYGPVPHDGGYDNGQGHHDLYDTCGGSNVFGPFYYGGGCNAFGCWRNGGGCNSFGCWRDGGGCNAFGCWQYGGQCNAFGCNGKWDGRSEPCRQH